VNTMHFKYAVEVERTRSITQAADNLFMAQPNLSKAIRELEDTLGIILFERTSKGVVPTSKGAEFLVHAKNILAQLERMERLFKPGETGRQSLSVSIPRGNYIARACTRFAQELDEGKGIDLNVQETGPLQAIGNIADGNFHLGIIRCRKAHESYFLDCLGEKKLACDLIWEFECLALMSRRHPLAAEEKLTPEKLSQYIEVVCGDTVAPDLPADRAQRSEVPEGKKRIHLDERCAQLDLLMHIPSAFMWVSPVPDELIERYELVQRKCDASNHKYKDLLIYPQGYQFSALDRQFIDKLYACKNEVAFKEYV